jgi:hypothetical protein
LRSRRRAGAWVAGKRCEWPHREIAWHQNRAEPNISTEIARKKYPRQVVVCNVIGQLVNILESSGMARAVGGSTHAQIN